MLVTARLSRQTFSAEPRGAAHASHFMLPRRDRGANTCNLPLHCGVMEPDQCLASAPFTSV